MPTAPGREKRIFFIVNPHAGMGAVGRNWTHVERRARDRLGPFRFSFTEGPGHAIRLSSQAVLEGVDILVCVGGDGTLNEVVTGMMKGNAPIKPETLLGFIPNGTGCDFIRTVPIPKGLEQALDAIVTSRSIPLDLGRLSYRNHQGRPATRYFHNVASFGLGGEVDERVNRTTKIFGGFLSFVWALIASVLLYSKKTIRLRVDDSEEETVVAWNVVIANGRYHGGGMWVARDASVSDGIFHLTMIGDFSLPEVFWHLPKLYDGRLFELDKVRTLTGKKVEARSDERVLLDVDGEQPGLLPATVEIVPSALRLIIP
ncbi:MAG: diacylglycerol kinase family lipid kinase [Deltaproteobacteria bacterium]|nr:diacylglycerol kinase family lipid kinase [Deltaproteobacteria bacterium]